ncbi:MAG: hypothetical protein LH603_21750, partial [Pseudonocardia sp.]|nr:hypothetical protein [Pseudonocardia sp.]
MPSTPTTTGPPRVGASCGGGPRPPAPGPPARARRGRAARPPHTPRARAGWRGAGGRGRPPQLAPTRRAPQLAPTRRAPQLAPTRGGPVVVGVDGTPSGDIALDLAGELAESIG